MSTAQGLALGAAKDMQDVAAKITLVKSQIQATASNLSGAKDNTVHAKSKLASAAQIVSGGTGRGQELQILAGQSTVRIEALQAQAVALSSKIDEAVSHAGHVSDEIKKWAASIAR